MFCWVCVTIIRLLVSLAATTYIGRYEVESGLQSANGFQLFVI